MAPGKFRKFLNKLKNFGVGLYNKILKPIVKPLVGLAKPILAPAAGMIATTLTGNPAIGNLAQQGVNKLLPMVR